MLALKVAMRANEQNNNGNGYERRAQGFSHVP